jgi:hypothetical protein
MKTKDEIKGVRNRLARTDLSMVARLDKVRQVRSAISNDPLDTI